MTRLGYISLQHCNTLFSVICVLLFTSRLLSQPTITPRAEQIKLNIALQYPVVAPQTPNTLLIYIKNMSDQQLHYVLSDPYFDFVLSVERNNLALESHNQAMRSTYLQNCYLQPGEEDVISYPLTTYYDINLIGTYRICAISKFYLPEEKLALIKTSNVCHLTVSDQIVPTFSLTADVDRAYYSPGEMILLKITMKNSSFQEQEISFTVPWYDFQLVLVNDRGEVVPLKKELLLRFNPSVSKNLSLQPGETITFTYPLNDWYDISALGTYTVSAQRLFDVKKDKSRKAVTNNVSFTVTDRISNTFSLRAEMRESVIVNSTDIVLVLKNISTQPQTLLVGDAYDDYSICITYAPGLTDYQRYYGETHAVNSNKITFKPGEEFVVHYYYDKWGNLPANVYKMNAIRKINTDGILEIVESNQVSFRTVHQMSPVKTVPK